MSFATPKVIDNPAPRQGVPFGLFSVASPSEDTTGRWENGVTWEALTCDAVQGLGQQACVTNAAAYYRIDSSAININQTLGDDQVPFQLGEDVYITSGSGVLIAGPYELTDAPTEPIASGLLYLAGALDSNPGQYVLVSTVDRNGVDRSSDLEAYVTYLEGPGAGEASQVTKADAGATPPFGIILGPEYTLSGVSVPAVGFPKTTQADAPLGEADAFYVYAMQSCTPVGRDFETAQARATASLLAGEEARVEQAFLTGDLGNTPSLQGSTDLTPGGGPVTAVEAIAELERWLGAEYGSQGAIHMPRSAAGKLLADDVLSEKGGKLYTRMGTPVAAGIGYELNVSPTGVAADAGTVWAYATPKVFAVRSEIFTSTKEPEDLLDRELNDRYSIAERAYLIGFDPCGSAAINFA